MRRNFDHQATTTATDATFQWLPNAGCRSRRFATGRGRNFFRDVQLATQTDLAVVNVDSKHSHFQFVADADERFRILDLLVRQFRNVQQSFQFGFQLNKDTEVGDLGDDTFDNGVDAVLLRNRRFPWVVAELFEAQGNSLSVLVDRDHTTFQLHALFEHFAGVRNLPCPRHV